MRGDHDLVRSAKAAPEGLIYILASTGQCHFLAERSAMAIPKRIPIKRIVGYRTEYIGTWSRGQFLGNVLSQTDLVAWAGGALINSRHWYVYLHEFDQDGNYLESTVESPGIGGEGRGGAMLPLEEWIASIPELTYRDIAFRTFKFEHDAITFGLIVEDGHGRD